MYFLFNSGGSANQVAQGAANGISKVGEAILAAYGAAEGSAATVQFAQILDGLIEGLHGVWFASCDGPLAVDVGIFMNRSVQQSNANTLDNFTKATGSFSYTPPKDYRNKDGDFIC